jgi:hypothetical protein
LLRAIQEKILQWTQECENSVNIIRTHLVSEPILILPQFEEPFQVETDACNYGIGGALVQQKKRIVCNSVSGRTL